MIKLLMLTAKRVPEQVQRKTVRTPWYLKFFDLFFAAASLIFSLTYVIDALPNAVMDVIYNSPTLSFIFRHSFWLFGFLFGLIYSIYWHRREKIQSSFPTAKRQAYLRMVTRFSLCYLIIQYGFMKFLGIHFSLGINFQEMPLEKLNGFFLTWYYFSFSRSFTLLIGLFELIGSILLLFRRTTLLGTCILLPLMVNVTLINYFYNIPVFFTSLCMTTGVLYVFLLYWEKLKQLFLSAAEHLPRISNRTLLNALRLGVVVLAFLTQMVWLTPLKRKPWDMVLQGKWKVEQQTVNGKPVPAHAWENDTTVSVWSNLYIEDGWLNVSTHPYIFDQTRAKLGRYTYDTKTKSLEAKFLGEEGKVSEQGKGGVFTASVDLLEGNKMVINGVLNGDTIVLRLTKVKPVIRHKVYWNWHKND